MNPELTQTLERYHDALRAFVTGDSTLQEALFSRVDDVSLANPLGLPCVGWTDVQARLRAAASGLQEGEVTSFDRVSTVCTDDLAFVVEVEHYRLRAGSAAAVGNATLRATTIFRREAPGWRVVHRHADPISGPRPDESVME